MEEIDVGEASGPRTICSGLVGHYTPDQMTGQLVIIAGNLKPRPMSGIESNGMVVCASNEDHTKVELLQPPAGAKPGERVAFAGHAGEPAPPNTMAKKKILESVLPVRAPLLLSRCCPRPLSLLLLSSLSPRRNLVPCSLPVVSWDVSTHVCSCAAENGDQR